MIIQIGTEADESRILWKHSESDEWQRADIDDLIDAYESRPIGKWIEVTNGRGGHECSECHSYAPSYASGDEHLSDYCPNCGVKMKGGAE